VVPHSDGMFRFNSEPSSTGLVWCWQGLHGFPVQRLNV
jgi:hypothetical protein